jgi:hypothetical protein
MALDTKFPDHMNYPDDYPKNGSCLRDKFCHSLAFPAGYVYIFTS